MVILFNILLGGDDQREEFQHDVDSTIPKLDEWKAHILTLR